MNPELGLKSQVPVGALENGPGEGIKGGCA
jgi:hypothetical protein